MLLVFIQVTPHHHHANHFPHNSLYLLTSRLHWIFGSHSIRFVSVENGANLLSIIVLHPMPVLYGGREGEVYNDDSACARNTINTLIIFQHLWHVQIEVNAHSQLFALSELSYVIALKPIQSESIIMKMGFIQSEIMRGAYDHCHQGFRVIITRNFQTE